ncbi:hypothetical protein GN244_ATG17026 [Phytophthora infestans]|uniref:MULE transposase domain-containing protein n=1 Tax=Phytophthora infestans TaxID=4787 RepID=A0A833SS30_PHYIN|nr:hypothetical protein GN244_ATG17026 [Phytophthora infestans]
MGLHLMRIFIGAFTCTAACGKGTAVCDMFFRDSTEERIVETLVIDMDFTEWRVLRDAFNTAKVVAVCSRVIIVILCQFHAIVAVQKKLADKTFDTVPSLRGELDIMWPSCLGMWAKYARGNYYICDNTTSNRLEATWKQI